MATRPKIAPKTAAAKPGRDLAALSRRTGRLTTGTDGGMNALGSALSVERLLGRFGWLGDADEVLRRAGITRAQLRALEGDDEIYAALETRRDAACNTPWRFEHANPRDAGFFDAAFRPLMPELLRHAWGAVPYGYSVLEAVYRPAGEPGSPTPGYIGLAQVIGVPFEWVQIQPDGQLYWADSLQPLDERKFLAAVKDGSLRKPTGESILSRLYWPWFFRTHGWKFWMKYLERCAVPFLYGKTDADKEAALAALGAAVQDAVIVTGTGDEIGALNMGDGKVDFGGFEVSVVRRYQRAILGQTLTSGTDGGSGNRALGQVHNEVRLEKKEADCRLLAATVQRLADRLAALNGIAPPKFIMEDGSGLEMERAQRDKILVESGMLRFTPEYLGEKYGLEEGDFVVGEITLGQRDGEIPPGPPSPKGGGTPPAAPAASVAPAKAGAQLQPLDSRLRGNDDAPSGRGGFASTPQFADGDKPPRAEFTAGQQAIEDQIGEHLAALPSPIDAAQIRGAILAARDADDLVERLGLLLRDADRSTFNRVLERALFAADVMGYAHAGDE
jgi:hypothetical protein